MRAKILIKQLQQLGENKEIFYSIDRTGEMVCNMCGIETNKKCIILFPYGTEMKMVREIKNKEKEK